MCFLETLTAALIATGLWRHAAPGWKLGTLSLMYWGAALMWTVDGVFRLVSGEPFLTMTLDDMVLGLLIVACGVVGWLLTLWWSRRKAALSTAKHTSP